MKRGWGIRTLLIFLLTSVIIPFVNAQLPSCFEAVKKVSQDTLIDYVSILTGKKSTNINGSIVTINSRFAYAEGNELSANYLYQACSNYGYHALYLPFSSTGKNVVAYKTGLLSDKKAFLLCAHYDCVGSTTIQFPGADDNASGTAALLEIARILKDTDFPFTIAFVFFDEEEQGLLGSKVFAPTGPFNWNDLIGVINLDMIGFDSNNDSLVNIHTFPINNSIVLANSMDEMNRKYQIGLKPVIINPGEFATDHASFWNTGVTAVGLTEDYNAGFNPGWHKSTDRIEEFNFSYFKRIVELALATFCEASMAGSVGINDAIILNPTIHVYPNPSNDKIFVELVGRFGTLNCIQLFDAQGCCLLRKLQGNEIEEIDLSLYSKGVYLLTVTIDGLSKSYRIVKF